MENSTVTMNDTCKNCSKLMSSTIDLISPVFFTLMSLNWYLCLLLHYHHPPKNPLPSICYLSSLIPWSGLLGLLVPGLATSLTIAVTDGNSWMMAEMVTIYLSFSLTGLVDLVSHYKNNLLPHHTHTVSLLLSFMVELILLTDSEYINMSNMSRHCLMMTVSASLTCCLARLVSRDTSSSWHLLCLATLTQVQGSWTIHGRLLADNETWTSIYFSWHLLAVFSLHYLIFVLVRYITLRYPDVDTPSSDSSPSPSCLSTTLSTSSTYSPPASSIHHKIKSSLVQENIIPKLMENSQEEKIKSVLQTIDLMVAEIDGSDSVNDTLTEEVDLIISDKTKQGRVLVCERASPLEEFNTLHRNVTNIRASIKLKESNIV